MSVPEGDQELGLTPHRHLALWDLPKEASNCSCVPCRGGGGYYYLFIYF